MITKIFKLSICFILMVPIGTLTHEMGHMAVAKYYNYNTSLSYSSMHYDKKELTGFRQWLVDNKERLIWDSAFIKKHDVPSHQRMFEKEQFRISLGGPLQTFLTGCIGLLIFLIRRKRWLTNEFQALDWMALFLSLFFSRFVINAVMHTAFGFLSAHAGRGDEDKIAHYIGVSPDLFYGVLFV